MDNRFRPYWPDEYPEFLLELFKVIDTNCLLLGISLDPQFIIDYDAFKEWFTDYYAGRQFKLEWERRKAGL